MIQILIYLAKTEHQHKESVRTIGSFFISKNKEGRLSMILFVGEQDKGWFVPETAGKKNEKCEYSGFVSSLEELSKRILQGSFSAVILHLPSLVIMDYQSRALSLWIIRTSANSART